MANRIDCDRRGEKRDEVPSGEKRGFEDFQLEFLGRYEMDDFFYIIIIVSFASQIASMMMMMMMMMMILPEVFFGKPTNQQAQLEWLAEMPHCHEYISPIWSYWGLLTLPYSRSRTARLKSNLLYQLNLHLNAGIRVRHVGHVSYSSVTFIRRCPGVLIAWMIGDNNPSCA